MTPHQLSVLILLAGGAVVRREPGQSWRTDHYGVYRHNGRWLRACRHETWRSLVRRGWASWHGKLHGGGVVELRITDEGRVALEAER